MKQLCRLLAASTLVFTQAAGAETWVDVGEGFFADKHSAQRKGDLAEVTVRSMSAPDSFARLTFDCKNSLMTVRGRSEPVSTKDLPAMKKAQEIACRERWKFWK